MRERILDVTQRIAAPRDAVFAFFADARNLGAITPSFLHFRILTPTPIEMRAGARIDYSIRLHGVPMRWRTLISAWEPGKRFVDEQISGPYRLWVHEHTFASECDARGGEVTVMRDVVRYATPLDPLVHGLFVRPKLERIFAYRRDVIGRLFPGGPADPAGASVGATLAT